MISLDALVREPTRAKTLSRAPSGDKPDARCMDCPLAKDRCANCERRIEPPVCECEHHHDSQGFCRDLYCICGPEDYIPQPTLCDACERAAKDEAAREMADDNAYANWKDED